MNHIDFSNTIWNNVLSFNKANLFQCFSCNKHVASEKGYMGTIANQTSDYLRVILICPNCQAPNILELWGSNKPTPLLLPTQGKNIENLPKHIEYAYKEARQCLQASCYTASVMMMRKLLQNIAVEEGAEEGRGFKYYVEYLFKEGIAHKKSKHLLNELHKLGNQANHKIESRTQEEATFFLKFIEQLLLDNYEYADIQETKKNKNTSLLRLFL